MVTTVLEDILELAEILEPHGDEIRANIPWWHPRCDGEGDGDGDGDGGGSGDGDGDGGGSGGGSGDGDDDKIDWKAMARKHERRAKEERKAREAAESKVKDRDDLDKSATEKAVEAARQEGEKSARDAAEKERRSDRLETATIRLASKGFKVKRGDDEVTLKFADPDDAHTYMERMLRRGDLDEDEIFDDSGRVRSEALSTALRELLEDKPHLAAGSSTEGNGGGSGGRRVAGSADQGKGGGGSSAGKSDLTVEQQFERIRQAK